MKIALGPRFWPGLFGSDVLPIAAFAGLGYLLFRGAKGEKGLSLGRGERSRERGLRLELRDERRAARGVEVLGARRGGCPGCRRSSGGTGSPARPSRPRASSRAAAAPRPRPSAGFCSSRSVSARFSTAVASRWPSITRPVAASTARCRLPTLLSFAHFFTTFSFAGSSLRAGAATRVPRTSATSRSSATALHFSTFAKRPGANSFW